MARNVHSDTTAHEFMDCSDEKPQKEFQTKVKEGVIQQNEATAFTGNQQRQPQRNQRPAPAQRDPRAKPAILNQFNISGGTIGQASIGNEGPVTFNQRNKVFQKGAMNTRYKITGGNFSQATIGGQSVFNNKGSTINATDGGGDDITVTPEQLTICILEKGVTEQEFAKLLERRYSLAQIACSIPNNPNLKGKMIRALLTD